MRCGSRSDAAEKLTAGAAARAWIETHRGDTHREAKLLEVILARGEAENKVEHLAVVSSGLGTAGQAVRTRGRGSDGTLQDAVGDADGERALAHARQ
jgi:hypothetical protein